MFGNQMGLSAQAIAGYGNDHPWDPSDLLRCMNYCRAHGVTDDSLATRMKGRSVEWDRLLPEWERLTTLLRHEMETRTDGTAPLTYNEMKRVLANGTTCSSCGGTGRGVDCPKCKGTGRRSGGRCRAPHCYWGADYCAACRGRGYTIKEGA